MDSNEILRRIRGFPRWHYQFDLGGHLTPVFKEGHINRHRQRRAYFMQPLIDLFGGSLKGKRVLDLGCNAGYWSLAAIAAGCEFVLGIEGRRMHVDQAHFVFDVHGIDRERFHFIEGNVFEVDFRDHGTFDVVLFLGLLYHVSKPVVLMEKIAEVNTDVLVIDTGLTKMPGSFLEIRHEPTDEPRYSVDYSLVIRPTRRAVVDLAQLFGYSVAILKPQFDDYTGAEVYEKGKRRAFICTKQTPVDLLPVPLEPVDLDEPAASPPAPTSRRRAWPWSSWRRAAGR